MPKKNAESNKERGNYNTLLEALNQAIIKWSAIYHGVGVDRGTENCAFVGCPITAKTNDEGCRRTPYEEWEDHQRYDHGNTTSLYSSYKVVCPVCRELAYKELKFLYNLYLEEKYGPKKS